MHIAYITCVNLPEPDPDEDFVLEALRRAGHDAALLPWDDAAEAARDFDLAIFRSCWNYHERPQEFLDFVAAAELVTRLRNPAAIIRWNIDKRYLQQLHAAGVPIVPTEFIPRDTPRTAASVLDERGWNDVVIKPVVSASSFLTHRFARRQLDAAQRFLDDLLNDRDAMVQPYLSSVESPDHGEKALVWIDGEVTHAVRKHPRFADADELVTDALPVTDEERTLAERTITCVEHRENLLYGRVDVMRDARGRVCVSELELLEPSLFFLQCPAALHRFVAAIDGLSAC